MLSSCQLIVHSAKATINSLTVTSLYELIRNTLLTQVKKERMERLTSIRTSNLDPEIGSPVH